jgi:hypothetical protein
MDDAGAHRDSGTHDAAIDDPGPALLRVPGWSVRKRMRAAQGDLLLEEVLVGFASPTPGATRVRRLAEGGRSELSFSTPGGGYISDFCQHESGAVSAVVVGVDRTISLVRVGADFTAPVVTRLSDPAVLHDPHAFVTDGGPVDLLANGFAWDAARVVCVGGDVVATVVSEFNSIIAYRVSFSEGAWSTPQRTLVEPPAGLTPFLPTGGSFDTFGAMVAWFRSMLDVDEDGNVYVAAWASTGRIRAHVSVFGDGLKSVPGDPGGPLVPDSDVLVTKLDPGGARVWTRVVGTSHEDEPYALRARAGVVAVAGRARRFPGFDNTTWDGFVAVVGSGGDVLGVRAIPLNASGIFLAVDVLPGGGILLGGSDGWSQNPDGLSVLTFGCKLLLELPTLNGEPARIPLAEGPRHNEIRTVTAEPRGARAFFGGHEDGPIMHTGDADPTLIHATGVAGFVEPERVNGRHD